MSKQVEREMIAALISKRFSSVPANVNFRVKSSSKAGLAELSVNQTAKRFFNETLEDFADRVNEMRKIARRNAEMRA